MIYLPYINSYKPYTGIGSRQTPINICNNMTYIANKLQLNGLTLRSGHAKGADIAFEKGAGQNKEIYLPWRGFNGSKSKHYDIIKEAFYIAEHIHPCWAKCSDAAKKLHARNVHQLLGQDLKTPSLFVLCWTPNAKIIGGTATVINLAKEYKIKVVNLANQNLYAKTMAYIMSI